ncbi:hypothetical protein AVEN_108288-1 [Araneus ventricosus]|uniref:Uncharacterized protein n=1 Tax=Araneus ventricosus TaxID=182803 RepID=A0A4Y2US45_ARAVE|nr:hypothetical protein AVEN_108288-1 [Araneus ventricosus]
MVFLPYLKKGFVVRQDLHKLSSKSIVRYIHTPLPFQSLRHCTQKTFALEVRIDNHSLPSLVSIQWRSENEHKWSYPCPAYASGVK